jgi:hypothetical protein
MTLVSIILIVGGIGTGYYLYLKSPLAKPTIVQITSDKMHGVISSDSQEIFSINGIKGDLLAQKIQGLTINKNAGPDNIIELIFSETIGSTTSRVTSLEFIKSLNYNAPDIFKRSLMNNWMYGVYGDNDKNTPFMILKTDFFQNSYAGMLKWENSITDELATLLNYKEKIKNQNSTGTSTINTYLSIRGKFHDKILLNRDVREFINEDGITLLVYSFVDNGTLVITTSEEVLKKIIQELEKQSQIR